MSDEYPFIPKEPEDVCVSIEYTPEYKSAINHINRLVHEQIYTEETMKATLDVMEMNPAHYAVYELRRKTIDVISYDLNAELEFTHQFILKSIKVFQLWNHLEEIISKYRDSILKSEISEEEKAKTLKTLAIGEIAFSTSVLDVDSKNYHCWTYRQFIIRTFDIYEGELAFSQSLIVKDRLNNSAWSYRMWVIDYWFSRYSTDPKFLKLPSDMAKPAFVESITEYSPPYAYEGGKKDEGKKDEEDETSDDVEIKRSKAPKVADMVGSWVDVDEVSNISEGFLCDGRFVPNRMLESEKEEEKGGIESSEGEHGKKISSFTSAPIISLLLSSELYFATQWLKLTASNESGWNYLKGLLIPLRSDSKPTHNRLSLWGKDERRTIIKFSIGKKKDYFCQLIPQSLVELLEIQCDIEKAFLQPYPIALFAEYVIEKVEGIDDKKLKQFCTLCDKLAFEFDTVKAKYWVWMKTLAIKSSK
ncbi:hypothetical protein ADUPG1_009163 [Aduncisulcus paluster]|uniref:Protein farnesyltransferase/geranylgeranyltransferase type-1 subunit alpha n=1 Tax=Aduncisulcus paluster TaxID=2918883 RepID=A0ABQ5KUK7_9EUKA|nr:hypothetical protein ADUPG1_009163 [Aduncisulcus paluster]